MLDPRILEPLLQEVKKAGREGTTIYQISKKLNVEDCQVRYWVKSCLKDGFVRGFTDSGAGRQVIKYKISPKKVLMVNGFIVLYLKKKNKRQSDYNGDFLFMNCEYLKRGCKCNENDQTNCYKMKDLLEMKDALNKLFNQ